MGLLCAELLCCLLSVMVSWSGAQRGESLWCFLEDVKDTGMPIPSISEQYSTNIQLNYENRHFSSEVKRTVDTKLNRSTVEIWASNRHVKYITLGDQNTFLTIDYSTKGASCSAKQISGKAVKDLYVGDDKVVVGALLGFERLIPSNEARFISMGPDNIKGIYVQQWDTCTFVSEINDAVDAKISFADAMWKPSHPAYPTAVPELNTNGIPVQIIMKIPGRLLNSDDYTDIIIADFSNFLPFAPADDEFQPPEDVHCANLRTAVKRPSLRNYFHYNAEVITHKSSTDVATFVSYSAVYYDYKAGLVRIDLQDSSAKSTATTAPLGTVVASVIRDFKAGIQYTIDSSSGKCNIETFGGTYDVFGTEGLADEDILEPTKYFYLDSSQISNLGKYSHRGLMTDVFSSLVKIKDQSRILRWYFTEDKVQLNEEERVQKNVLVKMVSKPESSTGKDGMTEINFYNFVQSEPSLFTYDVASCYNETLSKTFILSFPGDTNAFMQENTNAIKEKVHKTITENTGLRKTRVSVHEVIFRIAHLYAQFTMFDVLLPGIKAGNEEITLNEAVNKLQTAVSNGTVKIIMSLKDSNIILKADPSGLKEYATEEKTQVIREGFAQGSIVGLAFGMIILGFLIGGVVVNLIISRKHGVSLFQKAGFGNSATSFNNPLNESSM